MVSMKKGKATNFPYFEVAALDGSAWRGVVGRSPVVPGDERSLAVVGAVLVVLAVRLEELGEGGGRPLGLAHQDVRDGRPLHRSLPAFSKYILLSCASTINYEFLKLSEMHE